MVVSLAGLLLLLLLCACNKEYSTKHEIMAFLGGGRGEVGIDGNGVLCGSNYVSSRGNVGGGWRRIP